MHSFICHALGFELCYLECVHCQPLNGNLALKMRVHCEKDFVQWKTGYMSRLSFTSDKLKCLKYSSFILFFSANLLILKEVTLKLGCGLVMLKLTGMGSLATRKF